MAQPPCNKTAYSPLPRNHFAILFEGAWIFTPFDNGKRIQAICPITDHMHQCEFGLWDNEANCLDPVDGFNDIEVRRHTACHIAIETHSSVELADNFYSSFRKAAAEYPFVYHPAEGPDIDPKVDRPLKLRRSAISGGRSVVIPIPNSLRAAGALLTTEVGGGGKSSLFGQELVVKRPFVTFLFIYEYCGSLKAEVCRRHRDERPQCGYITAEEDSSNPTPHLIFRVFPTMDGLTAMFSDNETERRAMRSSGQADQSMLKVHASTTFEILRQAIPVGDEASKPCCDIALYHDQDDMRFDCGDVGLSEYELGLALPKDGPRNEHLLDNDRRDKGHLFDKKIASCAGGSMAADTEGILED
jgi:hypothetical protein